MDTKQQNNKKDLIACPHCHHIPTRQPEITTDCYCGGFACDNCGIFEANGRVTHKIEWCAFATTPARRGKSDEDC